MTATDVSRAIEAVWRIEAARLIGALTRRLRDVALAEDLAQEALLAALEEWPRSGIPQNPGAWLMTTARNRGIDQLRHAALADTKHALIAHELEVEQEASGGDPERAADDTLGDDVLRLMFLACHPLLSTEARTALTLKLIGGLTTGEIARAFLVSEPTVAQRIVRAKRTLSEAQVPFELPRGAALAARLGSVLEVIYLLFNEGYAATAGGEWMRPALCEEALRLARILAALAPLEAEAQGLLALLELQGSRLRARTGADGEALRLTEQNRAQWDQLLIQRGLQALARGESLPGPAGPYLLQAQIAACHARAATPAATDWTSIANLYQALAEQTGSPVVELNRAVAVAMAHGPAAGLTITEGLAADGRLAAYHLLPSVRADLLERLGRLAEARAEFERAATLTRNERERALLERRAAACARTVS